MLTCSDAIATNAPQAQAGAAGVQADLRKTRLCRDWARTGACSREGRCRFAHGEEALREEARRQAGSMAAAAPDPATRVLELERELRERDAMLARAHRRLVDVEAALRAEAAALARRAEAAEARAEDLALQLSRARREAGAGEAGALAGALAGETSTASFAELAAGTGGFAASRILGRGGFGPVYRGEWAGQAVAIKRLDHVRTP